MMMVMMIIIVAMIITIMLIIIIMIMMIIMMMMIIIIIIIIIIMLCQTIKSVCCSVMLFVAIVPWNVSFIYASVLSFDLWDKAVDNVDGLVQDFSNSNASVIELQESCTKPSIWSPQSRAFIIRSKELFSNTSCHLKCGQGAFWYKQWIQRIFKWYVDSISFLAEKDLVWQTLTRPHPISTPREKIWLNHLWMYSIGLSN